MPCGVQKLGHLAAKHPHHTVAVRLPTTQTEHLDALEQSGSTIPHREQPLLTWCCSILVLDMESG